MLSLDVMDISGEHQVDLTHAISKTRISKDGQELETTHNGRESQSDTCIGQGFR